MELRSYLTILRRWWRLVVALAVIGALVAYVAGLLQKQIYASSTKILVNQASSVLPSAEEVISGLRVAATYSELIHQRPVLEEVIAKLQLDTTPEDLDKQVRVVQVRDTNILELTVRDEDAQRAATIANEIVTVFIKQNRETQESRFSASLESLQAQLDEVQVNIDHAQADLDRTNRLIQIAATDASIAEKNRLEQLLADYQSSYTALLTRFEDIRLTQAQSTDKISVVETALPGELTTQHPLLLAVEGLILGLMLGGGAALLIEYLNDTIRSSEEAETLTGVPSLGAVGQFAKSEDPYDALVSIVRPKSSLAESYRVLRASLEFVSVTDPFRTLLITSSSPSEGKSTTAANLAASIAQVGKRVILVDMDLRRPTLHKMFHMGNTRGVTSALLQDGIMLTEHVFATEVDNLYLMPSGAQPPKPADLLQTQRAIDLIEGLKSMSDVVILDTPPILAVADPVLLARMCDAALLVVRAESTKIGALRQAKDQLAQSGVHIAGLIFNGVTESTDGYYYKYQHYYRSSDEK